MSSESYYPAADLRALAQHLFRHFERASVSGALGKFTLVVGFEGPPYRGLFAAAARDLGNPPEYVRLKEPWKRLVESTFRDDLLRSVEELGREPWGKGSATVFEIKRVVTSVRLEVE